MKPTFGISSIFSLLLFLSWTPPVTGQSWTPTSAPQKTWFVVASSADGSKLVAASDYGGIFTSTNSGATWFSNSVPFSLWGAVASSADGSKLAAAAYYNYEDPLSRTGFLYTSTNSGLTWNMPAPRLTWSAIACSEDGSKLVAATVYGRIYVSTNSGETWQMQHNLTNAFFNTAASSADGTKLILAGTIQFEKRRTVWRAWD